MMTDSLSPVDAQPVDRNPNERHRSPPAVHDFDQHLAPVVADDDAYGASRQAIRNAAQCYDIVLRDRGLDVRHAATLDVDVRRN
jgi:hypothetical protein